MNWLGDQSIELMCRLKKAAEDQMGRRCVVRQLLRTPHIFQVEFDLETPEERQN